MVVKNTEEVNLYLSNRSVGKCQVFFKIEPKLKWLEVAAGFYYIHALNIREILELLQLWLGMKFGFNIIGILLG